MLLVTAVALANMVLGVLLNDPLPPEAVDPQQQAAEVADAPPAAVAPAVDQGPVTEQAADPIEAPLAVDPPVLEQVEVVEEEWFSLGSANPESPYRMQVTLSNRGAAIDRLILNSARFSDLDYRGGDLGYLAATDEPAGGSRVNVVGEGTPAYGVLQVGDVIHALDGAPVETSEALQNRLAGTRPGQQVAVEVDRQGVRETVQIRVARRPLAVLRNELENLQSGPPHIPIPAGAQGEASLLLTLSQLDDERLSSDEVGEELPGVSLRAGCWQVVGEPRQDEIVFRQVVADDLEVIKTYRLAKVPEGEQENRDYPGYHLELQLELRNRGAGQRTVACRLDGFNGLPIEGWWFSFKISQQWFKTAGVRDLVTQFDGEDFLMTSASNIIGLHLKPMIEKPLSMIGVDAQYFSAVLLPDKERSDDRWFSQVQAQVVGAAPEDAYERLANVSFRLDTVPETLQAGETWNQSYRLFVGPKRSGLLEQYTFLSDGREQTLQKLLYFGWALWAGVARVMQQTLHLLHGIVGNYGLAIILLTVIVRAAMFPLSRKQAQSMIKMQALQPEMKKIQEKYKTDMQKRSQVQQELFRKHGVNPAGGCLLMLLQLPIFFGLYRALMVDVELRQAPLISSSIRWCSNLGGPDKLWDWSGIMPDFVNSAQGILSLGPYFNILPVVTVVLFLLQQKMFMPPATDETQVLQQKIMKYMMVFMGLLFFKVASGLCIYFIASSLWGIGERKMLPKAQNAPGPTPAAPEPAKQASSSRGSSNGSGRRSNRKKSKGRRR